MGLVDQVKNKLNIGNKDDAPTTPSATTSNTPHHTTTRKTPSFLLFVQLYRLLLTPKYKSSWKLRASQGDSLDVEARRAGRPG